jgi:hypothetical protein
MVRKLIEWSLSNPLVVVLLAVAFAAVGVFSFLSVNVEAYPDPAPAIVEVIALFPGASAEEVERQVTIPLDHLRRRLARAGQRLCHGCSRLGERRQHLQDAGEEALHLRRQQDVHLRVLLAHDRPGKAAPPLPLLRLLAGAELQPFQRLL